MANIVHAHVDRQRRTCIVLTRTKTEVRLIRLSTTDGYLDGLKVEAMGVREFDEDWKPLSDYPVAKAARCYAGFAPDIGATEEAMHELAKFTTITKEEITMATAKRNAASPVKGAAAKNEDATHKASLRTGTKKDDLPAHGKAAKPAKEPAAKPKATKGKAAEAKPEPKKAAAPKGGKAQGGTAGKPGTKTNSLGIETAANMFRTLIREGKLSDDAIFKKVQAKFGLDDGKRSYVGWYRNQLKKAGEKVPDPR